MCITKAGESTQCISRREREPAVKVLTAIENGPSGQVMCKASGRARAARRVSSVTRSPIDLPDCARAREKRTVDGRLGLKGRASGMKPVPDRTPDSERMGGGRERKEERKAQEREEGGGE